MKYWIIYIDAPESSKDIKEEIIKECNKLNIDKVDYKINSLLPISSIVPNKLGFLAILNVPDKKEV